MPIYEYQCKLCGKHFEIIQKISDAPLKTCEACGKPGLEKLVSSPSFQLKGDGWYVTDFKDKNQNKNTEIKTETETKSDTDTTKTQTSKNDSSS